MIRVHPVDSRFLPAPRTFSGSVAVGRAPDMDIVVPHWRVARRHAQLIERSQTLWIRDLSTWSGTWVNRRRVVAETPLLEADEVSIGPFVFKATWCAETGADADALTKVSAKVTPRVIVGANVLAHAHGAVVVEEVAHGDGGPLPRMPNACSSLIPVRQETPPDGRHGEGRDVGEPSRAAAAPLDEPNRAAAAAPLGASAHVSALSIDIAKDLEKAQDAGGGIHASPASSFTPCDADRVLRDRLQAMLLNALDLRREDVSGMSDKHLRARARSILEGLIDRSPNLCPADRRDACIAAVIDEAVGLGPLEPLLNDDSVTEIMVNRHDEIYVEQAGRLTRVATAFANDLSVLAVLERIVAPLGRRIDEASPMVDARLPDGSRVNGVIAPIALKGPTLTIRKFSRRKLTLMDLVAGGSLSTAMAEFLALCVVHKKNIVVSGGTGSGKTTLLNILAGLIGRLERIITIEDAAELQLPHDHVVSLEARPANIEGRGRVDIRDLVRNALRMRPDRIVVGECRGAEAFDMLAAMNTGHEGSLTTLHANTPRDALSRLETMILMAGMPLPLAAVREHISAGIDIIIQQARLDTGQRVLTDIAEVTGMDSGGIQLQSLLIRHRGNGRYRGAGVLPTFTDAWRERGIVVPAEWFDR